MTKEQRKVYYLNYRRSKRGLLRTLYGSQVTNSKRRNHTPPDYTSNELLDFYIGSVLFIWLYDAWVESNYEKGLRPSFDRKNSRLPYSFRNIELMTWSDNFIKGKKEKQKLPVVQLNLLGQPLKKWGSATVAAYSLSLNSSHISACCRNIRHTHGGFKWNYYE